MGSYSSKPTTETVDEKGGNEILSFGASSMQGWRMTQEVKSLDSCLCILIVMFMLCD